MTVSMAAVKKHDMVVLLKGQKKFNPMVKQHVGGTNMLERMQEILSVNYQ